MMPAKVSTAIFVISNANSRLAVHCKGLPLPVTPSMKY